MPASAPFPVPTMIEVGVASPRAQGQAMIRTATVLRSARLNAGSGPATSHTTNVSTASPMTTGTNTPVTASASRWIGAREPCASDTSRTTWARTVSLPTRVARIASEPVVLTVAPITSSPTALSTGRLSPVTMLSSTADRPSTTTPSTATFSPGRTRTRSPTVTASMGTSCSPPSLTTRAVRGASRISRRMASDVELRARASR